MPGGAQETGGLSGGPEWGSARAWGGVRVPRTARPPAPSSRSRVQRAAGTVHGAGAPAGGRGRVPPTLQGAITTPHPGSLIKLAQMARELAHDTSLRSWPPGEGGGPPSPSPVSRTAGLRNTHALGGLNTQALSGPSPPMLKMPVRVGKQSEGSLGSPGGRRGVGWQVARFLCKRG